MNFQKGSKRQLTPTPCPSEWSLSLEIMCMHIILSGPHTSLIICNHIHYKKNCNIIFRKWGGGGGRGVEGCLNFFRKFIRFGSATLPHSTSHCLVTSFHISNQSFKTKFCLDSLFLSFLLLHLAIILGLPIIASPTILSTTALDHFLLRFRPNGGVLSKWAGGKRTSRKMLALIFLYCYKQELAQRLDNIALFKSAQ